MIFISLIHRCSYLGYETTGMRLSGASQDAASNTQLARTVLFRSIPAAASETFVVVSSVKSRHSKREHIKIDL